MKVLSCIGVAKNAVTPHSDNVSLYFDPTDNKRNTAVTGVLELKTPLHVV